MSLFGNSRTRKRSFRYRVTVKGVTISKHYTKKAADTKAKSIKWAKVVSMSKKFKKTYSKTRRRY